MIGQKRKISIIMVTMMLAVWLFGSFTVQAEGVANQWVSLGNDTWTLQDGAETDITVKLNGNTLHVMGKGAIPAFNGDAFGNRPWHNRTIYELIIDEGITSIGANAFADFKYLHKINMYFGTYLEDFSAFAGLTQGTIFYLNGMEIVERNIGTIPYTNVDRWVSFMQEKNGYFYFRVANHYVSSLIQSKAYPQILNLSQLDVQTNANNPQYPVIDYTNQLTILSGDISVIASKSIINKQQGIAAMEGYALVIGDKTYATAYNITCSKKDLSPIKQTAEPYQFMINVPIALKYPGRQFSLIQIQPGSFVILDDEDMSDDTITFTTNYITTSYALIYTDTIQ